MGPGDLLTDSVVLDAKIGFNNSRFTISYYLRSLRFCLVIETLGVIIRFMHSL